MHADSRSQVPSKQANLNEDLLKRTRCSQADQEQPAFGRDTLWSQIPFGHSEVIYLVTDDSKFRERHSELLPPLKVDVVGFGSAEEYLDHVLSDAASCLILDLQLPGIGGLGLQRRLANETSPPIIFISGLADVSAAVRAIKAGAIEFLTKPVDEEALVAAISAAFVFDRERRQRHAKLSKLRERFSLLTPREREVLLLVAGGLLNKQAASVLGIAEVTLQVHRGQVMRKWQPTPSQSS
jgi:FixJ family two-component response regulator